MSTSKQATDIIEMKRSGLAGVRLPWCLLLWCHKGCNYSEWGWRDLSTDCCSMVSLWATLWTYDDINWNNEVGESTSCLERNRNRMFQPFLPPTQSAGTCWLCLCAFKWDNETMVMGELCPLINHQIHRLLGYCFTLYILFPFRLQCQFVCVFAF